MPFAIPMVWRELASHLKDCYFSLTKIDGFTNKTKSSFMDPDIPAAMRPVPHSEDNSVLLAPNNLPYLSSSNEGGSEDGAIASTSASPYQPN